MTPSSTDAPTRRPHVVAVGGGHGLSRTLQALRRLPVDVTAIVTTADDGGSSGRLRRALGVLPPGDLRKAIAALTPDAELAQLLEYRFPAGDVAGHTVGNLLLVAATELRGGDLVAALDAMARMAGARGRVLPASTEPLDLVAEGDRGEIYGQRSITRTSGHRRIRVQPTARATPEALDAVAGADLIVLGPGSLFTSILPNLAVPDLAAAVTAATAPVVLVANLREQPGETEGMDLGAHLEVLHEHLPDRLVDVLVLHDGRPPTGPGKPLEPLSSHPYCRVVLGTDLLDSGDGHDPERLAAVFSDLLPLR